MTAKGFTQRSALWKKMEFAINFHAYRNNTLEKNYLILIGWGQCSSSVTQDKKV